MYDDRLQLMEGGHVALWFIYCLFICGLFRDIISNSENILAYNSNQMHKSQSLFYLTTALHVSGVTTTHLQEHKTTVTTASGNRYTVLLSAAIVEELELV